MPQQFQGESWDLEVEFQVRGWERSPRVVEAEATRCKQIIIIIAAITITIVALFHSITGILCRQNGIKGSPGPPLGSWPDRHIQ